MSQMTTPVRVCFLSRKSQSRLSPFMTYHLISNKSNKAVERQLPTLKELMSSSDYKCDSCCSNYSIFFHFSFSFLSSYLFSIDLRLLITPLVSSNFSCTTHSRQHIIIIVHISSLCCKHVKYIRP